MFYTGLSGERAIDAYYDWIDEQDKMRRELYKEALEDELYLKDPELFIRMFSVNTFVSQFDGEAKEEARQFAMEYLEKQREQRKAEYKKQEDKKSVAKYYNQEIEDIKTGKYENCGNDDVDDIEVPF